MPTLTERTQPPGGSAKKRSSSSTWGTRRCARRSRNHGSSRYAANSGRAQSVETSDYWQGDEAKWQNTFGNGSGDIHISEVEYDDSTGSYQSQISMPVTDPETGEMLGAITFGINVQSLL